MEDLRYFHSTVAKAESQQGWALFLCKSHKKPKRPPIKRGHWYNPSDTCTWRTLAPHLSLTGPA